MAKRTVQSVVTSYVDAKGAWQTALRGEEVDVHADDVERFDRLDAPPAPLEPEDLGIVKVDKAEPKHRGK